jgi:2-oxoglutarate ferredoxin oxidoreductase subunit alpha
VARRRIAHSSTSGQRRSRSSIRGPCGATFEGDTAILTFGSGIGAAQEAARRLAAAGQPARVVSLRVLSPLPVKALAGALDGARRVVVMEQNHGAQLYHHLLAHQAIPPSAESFARPGPLPFRAGEIAAHLA